MLKGTKKRVSNRSKKTWRKNIDTVDFDEFLEEKLRDERVGTLDDKKDEELFTIDTEPVASSRLLRKQLREQKTPRCFKILEPSSAVPDPIVKRNRVRTKEERKHPIKKRIEELKRSKGIIPKRILESKKQRELTLKKKKQQPKGLVIKEDVWETNGEVDSRTVEWMTDDTVRHTLTNTRNLKVKTPLGVLKKKSVILAIENPHPGMSYNPSYEDHQDLLKQVAEKEMSIQKEEAHIARVTTKAFSKVTHEEKERAWLEEMSQGIIKNENEKEEHLLDTDNEYKAINPPSNFEKKKTLKQKRKQKEQKKEKLLRKHLRMEKKKIADIYKLKFLNDEIVTKEDKQVITRQNKEKLVAVNKLRTKRLGLHKFAAPDLEFTRGKDLRGSLRSSNPQGSLLVDRFYSLQKRNILPPSVKQTRFRKGKVKRFVKPTHKTDEGLVQKKQKKKVIGSNQDC